MRRWRVDAVGAALFVALLAWVLLGAAPGQPAALVDLLLAAGAAVFVARAISLGHSWLAAGAVVMTAAAVLVSSGSGARGPLGYANAAAALCVVAAAAALVVAVRAKVALLRVVAALAALGFGVVPWLNGSRAAAALVCLLPLGLLARGRRGARAIVGLGACVVIVALAGSLWLGVRYRPGEVVAPALAMTVTQRRLALWSEALGLLRGAPVRGVGVGGFAALSPTARSDADAVWAHHEFFEVAAETGAPGLVLLIAVVGWGFARLWWGAGDRGAAVAALGLAASAAHASVDYVWHFPAVVLATAALVGAGSAGGTRWRVSRRPGSRG